MYTKNTVLSNPNIETDRTRQKSATPLHRENSKTDIHQILSLFDPALRPKIIPIKSNPIRPTLTVTTTTTTPASTRNSISFKRLGARITTIAAFSRGDKKR